jgi:hypothetical protein
MPAWPHTRSWNDCFYRKYRAYVHCQATRLKGRTEDCADLSVSLLVNFASEHGLPVNLRSDLGITYVSKGSHQIPEQAYRTLSWSTKEEFYGAVKRRIDASSLYYHNTIVNPRGPEPGDLLLNAGHAALIFAVYAPGVPHPKRGKGIPAYPGDEEAARQLHQLEYMRETGDGKVTHMDYLNHRGAGKPVKQGAELIYFADARKLSLEKRLEFRMYSRQVLKDWDGPLELGPQFRYRENPLGV